MPVKPRPGIEWLLWIKWLIANIAGSVIAFILVSGIPLLFAGAVGAGLRIVMIVMVVVAGAAFGVAQAYVLVRRIDRPGLWVLATAAGFTFGLLIAGVRPQEVVIRDMLIGGLMGFFQWLLLRRQFEQAIWWIPASIIGWTVGDASALAVGAVTGAALLILLQHPIQRSDRATDKSALSV